MLMVYCSSAVTTVYATTTYEVSGGSTATKAKGTGKASTSASGGSKTTAHSVSGGLWKHALEIATPLLDKFRQAYIFAIFPVMALINGIKFATVKDDKKQGQALQALLILIIVLIIMLAFGSMDQTVTDMMTK